MMTREGQASANSIGWPKRSHPDGSKVSADQIVRSLAPARIHLRRGRVDQLTIRIEGTENSALIEPNVRLNAFQCIFRHEKRGLHCAVMSPKSNGATRRIKKAASIGKTQCHGNAAIPEAQCCSLGLRSPMRPFPLGMRRRVPRSQGVAV